MLDPQKIRPPHYILTLLVCAIALQWIFKPQMLISIPLNYLGVLVVALGIYWMKEAHQLFTKNDTPVPHSEKPREVVTDGPYKKSRNPMYVAGGLIMLGIAICAGTWPFFLSWILMGLILDRIFIPWEERRMEELFGDKYLQYKKTVRRWI